MEQTVYGDVLFFVNFCMDFQCLFLTARLLHRPFRVWRAALASVLGALYACAALFLAVSGAVALLLDSGVCFGMCALTFGLGGRHVRAWLFPFGVYFGVSAAVGGVMSAIGALLSRVEIPLATGGRSLSSVAFFTLAVLGGALTFFWGRVCERCAKGRRAVLTVRFFDKDCTLHCIVDTGNHLRDPVGGAPVALVDTRAAGVFVPPSILRVAAEGCGALYTLPIEQAARVRLIPSVTATGQGMLLAIAPHEALLDAGNGPVAVTLLLAPVPLRLANSACAVLLPAELIVQ